MNLEASKANYLHLPSLKEVRLLRERLGWTQEELVDRLRLRGVNVSRSMIAKIETGRIDPKYSLVVGIFQVLYEALSRKRLMDVGEVRARDIASKEVEMVDADETLLEVWRKMEKTAFSQFPVKWRGRVVGSITEKTINQLIQSKGWKAREVKVKEVMGEPFPTVPPNATLPIIIHLLQRYQAVLIVKRGEVKGIITNADIGKVFTLRFSKEI